LPAVVGVLAPRIVLPRDFERRYGPEQRALMLAHEHAHRERGDTAWNALAALLQGLFWFNPLFHFAASRFRHDQELACDERVLAACPGSRRTYGEAMLATQLAAQPSPLGCHWGITHPLKERIEMLKRPLPNRTLRRAGLTLIAAFILGAGFAAWAAQADTKLAADEDFRLDAAVSIDGGEAKRVSIRDAYGHEFELRDETADGRSMTLTGTVTPVEIEGKAAFRIASRLKVDGMQDSSPVLVARAGAPAAIQIGDQRPDGSFHGVRIDMTITPTQRQENSAVTAVDMSRPNYPKDVAKAGIGGQVVLLVDVAADGSVSGVEVQRPSQDARLDAAAVERARAWRFKPKVEDGKPVASRIRVPVTFEPKDSKPRQKG
jgi:TonB family protein